MPVGIVTIRLDNPLGMERDAAGHPSLTFARRRITQVCFRRFVKIRRKGEDPYVKKREKESGV